MQRKEEKGFTLIELLIVVAILGVLAAVVIPNVGRFIGRGQTEAGQTELSNIQTAVISMMTDNGLQALPHPVLVATNDMHAFPDATSAVTVDKVKDPTGDLYAAGDNGGFVLYQHDVDASGDNLTLVNYTATRLTKGTYTVDSQGTVAQVDDGY